MFFDYQKLRGKIKEVCRTQENLAENITMSKTSLSQKLNNKAEFSQSEMIEISNILSIPHQSIQEYFFNVKVQITEQKGVIA